MDNLVKEKHIQFYNKFNSMKKQELDNEIMIGDLSIVDTRESEIMKKYADVITSNTRGRMLEVGYGGGVFARELQNIGVKEHVIIEPHPELFADALEFARGKNIHVKKDIWQNVVKDIGKFNGIFYDITSPPGEVINDLVYFIDVAFKYLLENNGVFTFWYCSSNINKNIYDKLLEVSSNLDITLYEIEEGFKWKFKNRKFIIFKAEK